MYLNCPSSTKLPFLMALGYRRASHPELEKNNYSRQVFSEHEGEGISRPYFASNELGVSYFRGLFSP